MIPLLKPYRALLKPLCTRAEENIMVGHTVINRTKVGEKPERSRNDFNIFYANVMKVLFDCIVKL